MERKLTSSLRFDNAFVRELPGDTSRATHPRQVHGALYTRVDPAPVARPRLMAHSQEVAEMLGIGDADIRSAAFAEVFGGSALVEGMEPYAANYGGHQFGQWAGQLGDGRAITLGEVLTKHGQRLELQVKGAGRTPYSRTADGRAVLRSSIREFLCSEAMHHLGVPTTRALSLVATGEQVLRDMFYDGRSALEPGAVVCRVAPSFIRFGNFELPASRGDRALVDRLIGFTIRRDFPELVSNGNADSDEVRAEWFGQVCERTAHMVAHWMRVGFVHGVMNTDNMSVLGLTIDYGPYGWIDNFDSEWTPNTTDAGTRRYVFGRQPHIAYWNLQRLAAAIADTFASTDPLEAGLARYVSEFNRMSRVHTAAKLGLTEWREGDDVLVDALFELLQSAEVDMTIFFRLLADVDVNGPSSDVMEPAFYDVEKRTHAEPSLRAWLERYAERIVGEPVDRRVRMNAVNPKFVLRNYLAQEAIDRAGQGDESGIIELLDVMRHPYDEQPGRERFAAKRPDWARHKAGCSMLSCSS